MNFGTFLVVDLAVRNLPEAVEGAAPRKKMAFSPLFLHFVHLYITSK
jgi:hypothetical protein